MSLQDYRHFSMAENSLCIKELVCKTCKYFALVRRLAKIIPLNILDTKEWCNVHV